MGVCRRKVKCKLLNRAALGEELHMGSMCRGSAAAPRAAGLYKADDLCTRKAGWSLGWHLQSGLSLGQFLLILGLIPGPEEGPLHLWEGQRSHCIRYY